LLNKSKYTKECKTYNTPSGIQSQITSKNNIKHMWYMVIYHIKNSQLNLEGPELLLVLLLLLVIEGVVVVDVDGNVINGGVESNVSHFVVTTTPEG
jgi:hypothetical protein